MQFDNALPVPVFVIRIYCLFGTEILRYLVGKACNQKFKNIPMHEMFYSITTSSVLKILTPAYNLIYSMFSK